MKNKQAIIIPDIHQDHRFLSRILDAEKIEDFQHVVLLGDYMDARDVDVRGPKAAVQTARLILEMRAKLGSRLVMLWGNHDLPYYAEQQFRADGSMRSGAAHHVLRELSVRPESWETAMAVAGIWSLEFWRTLKPFFRVGDFVMSHAGIHRNFFPLRTRNVENGLAQLEAEWDIAMTALTEEHEVRDILMPGEARGGREGTTGGPVWLDWNLEFADELPFSQIVGHSTNTTVRQRGTSHCIDYDRSAYGVLGDELEVIGI